MKKRKKNLRQILIPAFIITACIPLAIFALISAGEIKDKYIREYEQSGRG